MLVSVTDTLEIRDAKETADGYLALDGAIARTGIYHYLGAELGDEFADMGMVAVYRPESSVFNDVAMRKFAHKPITDDHPSVNVTRDNWTDLSRGWSGGEVVRDGEKVAVPMILADSSLIAKYRAGKVGLSPGYTADIVRQDGQLPDGTKYQAVMGPPETVNHIAVVDKGRGGPSIRLGDAWPVSAPTSKVETKPMPKRIIVDGIPIDDVSDAAEAVITTLTKRLGDANTALDAANTKVGELSAAVSTKDGEIAGLNQKLADATITPAMLDAAVKARGLVVGAAKRIMADAFNPDVVATLADADIRKLAVSHKLGDVAKDFDDKAILGAFTALTPMADASGEPDALRDALRDGGGAVHLGDAAARADAARREMIAATTGNKAA